MKIDYVEVGVCGLSCRLCPAYYRDSKSKCPGCKSEFRMGAACPFRNCALKRKGLEFCGLCEVSATCERWKKRREKGKQRDSIVCYQKLEENISFIGKNGLAKFDEQQKIREKLLRRMLSGFNEGRSTSFYCTAATVLEIPELLTILKKGKERSEGKDIKTKSEIMHLLLDEVATKKNYILKLRK